MAQFVNMHKVELSNSVAPVVSLRQIFYGDVAANRIGAIVLMNGAPVTLGGTCSGTAILADGSTVALTGTVSGNEAYVVLSSGCYSMEGQIQVFVKLTVSGVTTTLLAAVGTVRLTETDRIIDPGTIIPSVSALITSIEDAIASIPADYSALLGSIAHTFSTSTAYTAGQYVWYNGELYRFNAAHPAGAWIGTDAARYTATDELPLIQQALGTKADAAEVADLKSALNDAEEDIGTIIGHRQVYSGNVVDLSGETINPNLWITTNAKCVLDDGIYYQNPANTTPEIILRFYPVDADGNAITLTRNGNTETFLGWNNGYIEVFEVRGTNVKLYGYTSMHNLEIGFKTLDREYTLSAVPAYWRIEGKASSTSVVLNYGLTKGSYNTEYVPYAEPEKETVYKGILEEFPYIDVESVSEMTDTTKLYKLDGAIYYYNGSAWARLGVYSNDDVEHVDKNVFFTSMKYNESSGAVVNAGNVARTLQYIPVDAKQVIADGTHVTGIELLAWNNAGEYIGVWDAETAAFVTTAKMAVSVNLANLVGLYPEYKYKINVAINGIDAYSVPTYVSWVYSSSDNADRIADTLDGVMAFDCSAINVVDNTNISGANGIANYDVNYVSTDYVDISDRIANTIKFNCSIVANPVGFSVYDKGKRWISGLWGNAQTLPNYGYVSDLCPQRITWTLPDDAYYLRATMRKEWYTQPDDFGIALYRINRQSTGADDAEFITIAHKGYGFSSIENTLQSFINAGEIGFKAVEIDCRKMADGVYIASHSASATLYRNGTGESVTFATANWSDIKGKTIDAQGLYPLATVEQIFSTLRKYAVKYYIIDLKTGSNAEIIDIARRCGVVDRLLLSYYNASSLIADIDLLKTYPNIPIRFTPSLTNEQYQTVRSEITNQFFADINATEAGNTYIPNTLAWGIPILFSGATETSKMILGPVAAGAMANLTLQYSPAELTAMAALNYSQFPTLTASAESVSLSAGITATLSVSSDIDDPACYVYGYSDDLDVFSVAQTAYGANASFTLSKVGDGTANFIVFTATGEQLIIPVTVT